MRSGLSATVFGIRCLRPATGVQGAGQAAALSSLEAAAAAAIGSSLDSGEQGLEDDDEDMDDEMEHDDEDEEELAMRQPTVHDVHVSTEPADPAGASGRQRTSAPAR